MIDDLNVNDLVSFIESTGNPMGALFKRLAATTLDMSHSTLYADGHISMYYNEHVVTYKVGKKPWYKREVTDLLPLLPSSISGDIDKLLPDAEFYLIKSKQIAIKFVAVTELGSIEINITSNK